MNSLIGKSTGIALLMAAALLAALFAMGVFSPMGAKAAVVDTDSQDITVELDDPNPEAEVEITIKFRVNDDIDGTPANENVRIKIPVGSSDAHWKLKDGVTKPTVTVMQQGLPRGKATVTADGQITIGPADDATKNILGFTGSPVTVTVTDLKNPKTAGNYPNSSPSRAGIVVSEQENNATTYTNTDIQPSVIIYKSVTDASVSVNPDTAGATGVTMTIKFTPGEAAEHRIALPSDYDVVTGTSVRTGLAVTARVDGASADLAANRLTYANANADATPPTTDTVIITTIAAEVGKAITITIKEDADTATDGTLSNPTLDDDDDGSRKVTITAGTRTAVEGEFTVVRPPDPVLVKLSSAVPSAAVQITIEDKAAVQMVSGNDIEVNLTDTGFGVPSTIAASNINIKGGPINDSPSNVTVTGSKVSFTIPFAKDENGNAVSRTIGLDVMYTVTIKQSAGITNPAAAGEKTIKWVEDAPAAATAVNNKDAEVTIQRVIKLSKKKGVRGTMTTASLLGFADGTATVYLNDPGTYIAPDSQAKYKLAEVTVASNVGTLEIDTTSKKFSTTRKDADGKAIGNEITAVDTKGAVQNVAGMFTISPALAVDPAESPVSKEVELKLTDWPVDEPITAVQIGATPLVATADKVPAAAADATDPWGKTTPDGDKAPGTLTIKVLIPAETNRGTQTVKVTGTRAADAEKPAGPKISASATLKIGVLDLSVQPAMAVPGQVITVQGSGFKAGDTITTVMVGGKPATVREGENSVTVNTAGDFIATVPVPSPTDGAIGTGKKTVSVATATGSGRVAEGSIEIPEAAITLDPMESRRGTTVALSGTGFPASTVIQVSYGEGVSTIAAGTTDASGVLSMTFVVPGTAGIGKEHEVKATSVAANYAAVSAKETHSTPGATFELSASEVQRGGSLTISGMNFPAYSAVTSIMIGDTEVAPSPSPTTSNDGDFKTTVTVPGLSVGNYTVTVNAGGTVIAKSLSIVEAVVVVSTDPADVFATLIEAGVLNRVFHYDNATQEWTLYDPDPAFAEFNDLTSVSSGDIVWVNLTAAATFQGQDLKEGWSLVSIN